MPQHETRTDIQYSAPTTFRVGSGIPRRVGEKFFARPVAGVGEVIVRVVKVVRPGLYLVRVA